MNVSIPLLLCDAGCLRDLGSGGRPTLCDWRTVMSLKEEPLAAVIEFAKEAERSLACSVDLGGDEVVMVKVLSGRGCGALVPCFAGDDAASALSVFLGSSEAPARLFFKSTNLNVGNFEGL